MNEWIWITGEIIFTGENEGTWRRTLPSTIQPAQVHHRLAWDRKQATITARLANNHLSHGLGIVRGPTWSTAHVTKITH